MTARIGSGGPVFREVGAFLLALGFLFLAPVPTLAVQAQDTTWNDARTLRLVEDARRLRQSFTTDSTLRSYSADARGYVYFFLDREDTGERILVKTDQIALEVFWRAPNLSRQRIVGLRDEKSLPTNIRYHLDHLVVVQDNFGDRIRIGDGDEVESVVHPAAPGSGEVYDFFLADSVTLTLQGGGGVVRVYEVKVRPKNFDEPGFVGSIFLDRDTRAIVRMSFTFTPASYVDDYLDHISISLENGLWLDRHWLPFRQELEIRREVPYLDIPAGSVIRGWFDIRNYRFNLPLPPSLFRGRTVTALPESARRAFPFEDSLHAQLDREGLEGLRTPPTMEEIRAQAMELARDRYLSGLRRFRLFLPEPTVSSALRYNRAEGLFLGGGFSYGVSRGLGLGLHTGVSMGRERPFLQFRAWGGESRPDTRLSAYWNRPLSRGLRPAISGVLNSLAGLILNEDYTDVFFATGIRGTHAWSGPSGRTLELTARWEEQRSPDNVTHDEEGESGFRPVLPIDEGRWASLRLGASFPTPWQSMRLHGNAEGIRFRDRTLLGVSGSLNYRREWLTAGVEARGELSGGMFAGRPPRQALFLLGGRGTVPGYPIHTRMGDRYWLVKAEASRALLEPWMRIRAFGAAGRAWDPDVAPSSPAAGADHPGGPTCRGEAMASLGLGLGLGWDILRLDVARGLTSGGNWELILSVNRAFWPWL